MNKAERSKRMLESIIRYKGNCISDYCHIQCPLESSFPIKQDKYGRYFTCYPLRQNPKSHKGNNKNRVIYEFACKLYVARYGKGELVEILL